MVVKTAVKAMVAAVLFDNDHLPSYDTMQSTGWSNSLGINTPATDIWVGCHSSHIGLPGILTPPCVCPHNLHNVIVGAISQHEMILHVAVCRACLPSLMGA